MKDKKNMATVIVSKMKKPDEYKKAPEQDGAMIESDDYSIAADEIVDALEKKDKVALKEALKSFVQMCMDESPEQEPSEEQSK